MCYIKKRKIIWQILIDFLSNMNRCNISIKFYRQMRKVAVQIYNVKKQYLWKIPSFLDVDLQIQETQRTSKNLNAKKVHSRCVIINLLKSWSYEKKKAVLKTGREKNIIDVRTYNSSNWRFLFRNHDRKREIE